MTIQPIYTLQQLQTIASLLYSSYGESFDFEDEVAYFEQTQPSNWYAAIDQQGQPIGFIRYFPVGQLPLVQLECYASEESIKLFLLRYFIAQWKVDQTIRAIASTTNPTWLATLQRLGFESKTSYYTYTFSYKDTSSQNSPLVRAARPDELPALQQLLQQEFAIPSTDRLLQNIKEQRILVLEKGQQLLGCSLNSSHEQQKEIIQLVIDRSVRRQGYGRLLVEQTMQFYAQTADIQHFYLRVKASNTAAIALYEAIGFEHTDSEYWMYLEPTLSQ